MSYSLGQNIRYHHPLKDEIYKKGYSLFQFSLECDIATKTLYNIFNLKTKRVRKSTIELMSEVLGMSTREVRLLCNGTKNE